MMSKFEELKKINVNDHTEKKNGLTYLSWAWAVDTLLTHDPAATWSYSEPVRFGETLMVFCTVNAFGKSMTAQLPVMDYRNKAIPSPDAMAVNTAMQRCLAKAIALHGIGLYIYAGEDLPEEDKQKPNESAKTIARAAWDEVSEEEQNFLNGIAMEMIAALDKSDLKEAHRLFYGNNLTNDEKTALWSRFDSKQRSAIKKYDEEQRKAA